MSGTGMRGPDGLGTALLVAGAAVAAGAYFLPAVSFAGRDAVHGMSIFQKLPLMSLLAFAALGAAVAARLVPALRHRAEEATIAAIVIALAPAIWGFVTALDAWSGVKATMLQITGTRTVKVDPALAYVPLLLGAVLMAASLRLRRAAPETAAQAA